MKTNAGLFFEDYCVGQVIDHAVPRTVGGGERALYHALYPARHALYSSDCFAQSCGLPQSPLDDLIAAHGADIPKKQLITIDGKVMAVAFMANAQTLAYRKDVLAEIGVDVPKTYEDVLAAAEKIRTLLSVTFCSGEYIYSPQHFLRY